MGTDSLPMEICVSRIVSVGAWIAGWQVARGLVRVRCGPHRTRLFVAFAALPASVSDGDAAKSAAPLLEAKFAAGEWREMFEGETFDLDRWYRDDRLLDPETGEVTRQEPMGVFAATVLDGRPPWKARPI